MWTLTVETQAVQGSTVLRTLPSTEHLMSGTTRCFTLTIALYSKNEVSIVCEINHKTQDKFKPSIYSVTLNINHPLNNGTAIMYEN